MNELEKKGSDDFDPEDGMVYAELVHEIEGEDKVGDFGEILEVEEMGTGSEMRYTLQNLIAGHNMDRHIDH